MKDEGLHIGESEGILDDPDWDRFLNFLAKAIAKKILEEEQNSPQDSESAGQSCCRAAKQVPESLHESRRRRPFVIAKRGNPL